MMTLNWNKVGRSQL